MMFPRNFIYIYMFGILKKDNKEREKYIFKNIMSKEMPLKILDFILVNYE